MISVDFYDRIELTEILNATLADSPIAVSYTHLTLPTTERV